MTLLNSLWDWALSNSLHGSVLIICALLLQWTLCRRAPARIAQILWFIVAVRLLVPAIPGSRWSAFNLMVKSQRSAAVSQTNELPWRISYGVAPSQAAAVPTANRRSEPSNKAEPRRNWSAWASLLWGSGMVVQAVALIMSLVRTRRLVKHSVAVRDPRLLAILKECAARVKIRRTPALLESCDLRTPAVCGLIAPRILLPSGLAERLTDPELRFIFLHECGHIRHGDFFVLWLLRLARVVHWFNPLIWLGLRAAIEQAELASDEMVLKCNESNTESYGLALLKLVKLVKLEKGDRVPGFAMGVALSKRTLDVRIRRMAGYNARSPLAAVIALLSVALVAIAFGANEAAPKKNGKAIAPVSSPEAPKVIDRASDVKFTPAQVDWAPGWGVKSVTLPSTGDIRQAYVVLSSPQGQELTLTRGVVSVEGLMLKELHWVGTPLKVALTVAKEEIDHEFTTEPDQVSQRSDLEPRPVQVKIKCAFYEFTRKLAAEVTVAGKSLVLSEDDANPKWHAPSRVEIVNEQDEKQLVEALQQRKDVTRLAAPTLLAKSGQWCSIESASELKYPVKWNRKGTKWVPTEFETKETSVSLEAIPTLTEEGKISLFLEPSITDLVGYWDLDAKKKLELPLPSGQFDAISEGRVQPIISDSKATANVFVNPGQAVIFTWLSKTSDKATSSPQDQRQLLVVATAYIASPSDEKANGRP